MRKFLLSLSVASGLATASAAEPVTIVALGDSLTHGFGLVPEDGFVPQLDRWLKAQGADALLINAGVSGDTTAGGASRVAWSLTPDVDAMIVALGGNDLLRGIDPASSRANLESILTTARDADVPVLLIGMEAPGNYGAAFKQTFDAIYPDLAAEFGTVYAQSFFLGLQNGNSDLAALRPFLQADGIHPNAQGVEAIVKGLGPFVLTLIERAS